MRLLGVRYVGRHVTPKLRWISTTTDPLAPRRARLAQTLENPLDGAGRYAAALWRARGGAAEREAAAWRAALATPALRFLVCAPAPHTQQRLDTLEVIAGVLEKGTAGTGATSAPPQGAAAPIGKQSPAAPQQKGSSQKDSHPQIVPLLRLLSENGRLGWLEDVLVAHGALARLASTRVALRVRARADAPKAALETALRARLPGCEPSFEWVSEALQGFKVESDVLQFDWTDQRILSSLNSVLR